MKKLSNEEVNKINKNMIVKETEKAYQLKVNYVNKFTGNEKEINIWVPKSCTEKTQVGILKIKDWFLKNKESELKGIITPSLVY